MDRANECGRLIKQLNDTLEKNANNALRPQGLTLSQISVLMMLHDAEGRACQLKSIEKFLHVAQSTAAGVVSRLEQKKFVHSFGDDSDKRIKMVRLTPYGEKCCVNVRANMDLTEQTILKGLSALERTTLITLLIKVNNNFR